jgi:hypothetical protein
LNELVETSIEGTFKGGSENLSEDF